MQKTNSEQNKQAKKGEKYKPESNKTWKHTNRQIKEKREKQESKEAETHRSKKQMGLLAVLCSVVLPCRLLSTGLFLQLRFYLANPRCSQVKTRHERIGLGFTCGWFRAVLPVLSDVPTGSLSPPFETSMQPASLKCSADCHPMRAPADVSWTAQGLSRMCFPCSTWRCDATCVSHAHFRMQRCKAAKPTAKDASHAYIRPSRLPMFHLGGNKSTWYIMICWCDEN
jgi:hypothetical protein